jgi:hypothetical protein
VNIDVKRLGTRLRERTVIDTLGSVSLFVFAAAMLVFYLVVTYRSQMHSDSAMKLLLGEQMAQQLTLLPRDWNYVNDIWIIFPHLVAAPLLLFFQPSMALHSVVDVIAAMLVLLSAWLAARDVGINGALRWLPMTLVASGLSGEFAEVAFGQSAYSGVIFTFFLLCGSASSLVAGSARPKKIRAVALLLLASAASGPRGVASFAAPFILASAGLFFLSARDAQVRRASSRLLVASLAGSVVGGIVFLLLRNWVHYHEGAVAQGFATHDLIANHMRLIVANWFSLFAALPPSGGHFSSVAAAISMARIAVALGLFLLPLFLLFRINNLASQALKFLVLFHASILVSTIYLLIFTGVFVDEVHGASRYLIPLLPSALLISTLWLQQTAAAVHFNAARAGWLVALAMLSLSPLQLVGAAFANPMNIKSGLRRNSHAGLVETLKAAHLDRGYADYWDASVVSILSGGDVRIAPVNTSEGLPTAFHHLTSERWYEASWARGSTFLVVSSKNRSTLNLQLLRSILGEPSQVLRVDDFEILVYPFNIGERLGYAEQPFVVMPRMNAATCSLVVEVLEHSSKLKVSEPGFIKIRATNHSSITWSQNASPPFNPGLRIVDEQGHRVATPRGLLLKSVPPAGRGEVVIPFHAPAQAGNYKLYFSFVAEGDAWCADLAPGGPEIDLHVDP